MELEFYLYRGKANSVSSQDYNTQNRHQSFLSPKLIQDLLE